MKTLWYLFSILATILDTLEVGSLLINFIIYVRSVRPPMLPDILLKVLVAVNMYPAEMVLLHLIGLFPMAWLVFPTRSRYVEEGWKWQRNRYYFFIFLTFIPIVYYYLAATLTFKSLDASRCFIVMTISIFLIPVVISMVRSRLGQSANGPNAAQFLLVSASIHFCIVLLTSCLVIFLLSGLDIAMSGIGKTILYTLLSVFLPFMPVLLLHYILLEWKFKRYPEDY